MDLLDFFDVYNVEHLKAYKHLTEKGSWPEGFLPENCILSNVWQYQIAAKLAVTHINYTLSGKDVCVFCNSSDTVRFKEHYTFCSECSAIYTSMIIQKKNCDHITDNTVVVEHEPWYKHIRDSKVYIIDGECSECGNAVVTDGW